MVKKHYIALMIGLLTFALYSQSIISYVTVNPKSVYIGEPAVLKVSVFTSTWFTDGVDIGNIQVDGALTVFFRSVSTSKKIKGKQYSGVEFYYNLFPTLEGTLEIPELEIHVESPKVGGYKGIRRTTKTKAKNLSVKNIPLGYDPQNWLVATRLSIRENWSSPLKDIKVGDVIQRTITRSVSGTLSEFIPATKWDSIKGISTYPKRASINTNKSRTAVSASRSETVNYLFEKEGEIIIPTIEYLYWNSNNLRFYRKQIDSIRIQVKPNADLGILASIKKSLQKENIEEAQAEEKPFLIFGMTPKKALKYFVFLILGLYILFEILKKTIRLYKKTHSKYLQSERYAFKKVQMAIAKNDIIMFTKTSNTWLLKLGANDINQQKFIKVYGTEKLNLVLNQINEDTFMHNRASNKTSFVSLLSELKRARKHFFNLQKRADNSNQKNKSWLNPTVID